MKKQQVNDLPAWASEIVPLTVSQAAIVMGVGTSAFYQLIAEFPHYESHGAKKLFYPEHIEKLRKDRTRWQLLKSSGAQAKHTPRAPSMGSEYARALARHQK